MTMPLSRQSVSALLDLVENKLSVMTVNDRDDLREMIVLKRCLSELSATAGAVSAGMLPAYSDVPRRGRRRRVLPGMLG